MSPLLLFITTFPDEATAASTIRRLVEERLAACGTLIPKAKSIYFWEGKLEESNEVVVLLKTTEALQPHFMERLKKLHPYEVPEIIAVKPAAVEEKYLAWVQNFACNL